MYFSNDVTNYETRNGRTLPSIHQPRETVADKRIRESVYGEIAFGDYFDGIVTFTGRECEVRINGEVLYANFLLQRCIEYSTRHGLSFTRSQPRVLSFPDDVDAHREAQKAMFGAWSAAGLSRDKSVMLPMVNEMLDTDYESRTQLSEREMKLVTAAVRGGYFGEVAERIAA